MLILEQSDEQEDGNESEGDEWAPAEEESVREDDVGMKTLMLEVQSARVCAESSR